MRICDLVETYIDAILIRDEASLYEQARPELFDHYHTFWSKKRPYRRDLDATALRGQRELVQSRLIHAGACFAALSLDVTELEIVLFVGHGTTNGHAFSENGRFVVWIPIETYAEPLYTDVFLTHEIVHALHYSRTPAFYFETVEEKDRISRMLITEGLATYLTRVVLGGTEEDALWGGYLKPDALAAWMSQALRRFPEMCTLLAGIFTETSPESGLFCLYDTEDVCRSRGGYFAGLRLIGAVAAQEGLTPPDLLAMDRRAFGDLILRRLAAESA